MTSSRDLPMTEDVRRYFIEQKECGIKCNQTVDGVTDFVFVDRSGNVQHQRTLNKALRSLIKHANADPDAIALPSFSCHVLRHTYCTNLIMSGVELTAASALMGHRDISTTANIYNDVQREQMELGLEKMEAYVSSSGERTEWEPEKTGENKCVNKMRVHQPRICGGLQITGAGAVLGITPRRVLLFQIMNT